MNSRRYLSLSLILVAAIAAACSGGGSGPTPPPPVGGFTNADLSGQYAFLMSGQDPFANFFGRVGVFVADGNGHITGGIEDVNTASGEETLVFTSSTYTIGADGRGEINLTNSTGTIIFSVTLLSPNQGYMSQTDLNATASGTFNRQTTSAFTTTAINGNYVFDTSGIAPDSNSDFFADSIVGQLVANNGTFTGGVTDENFGAIASGPQAVTNGTSTLDANNGATFGRGLLSYTAGGSTFSYIYYIVDSTRVRLMETNPNGALTLGDATIQTGPPTNAAAFTGSFVYLMGGSSVSTGLPITRVGRFTSNGNGGLSSIAADTNDAGIVKQVPNGSLSATNYVIDPNFPGSGRGTLTYTDSSLGTFSYIFYMNSSSQGVVQDNSVNNVADGTILAQTGGPFTNAGLAGNIGFNWSGINTNTSNGATAEADYVGQVVLSNASSNNITGAVDFSDFTSNNGIFLNKVVNGQGLTINADGTSRNTFKATINTSPSATLNFAAYVANSNTIFVASTDSDRVLVGTFSKQSK